MRVRGIDAGGSMVRIARNKTDIIKRASACMEILEDAPTKGHIIEDKILDFVFRKSPCTSLVGRRFVKGEAMNQYSGTMIVCDNQEVKVLQEVTYINILYSIAIDCIKNGINDNDFKIGVCIPAAEYYDDNNDRINECKDNLAGDTSIYFPLLDRTIRFHIDKKNIGVVAEGVVAAYKFRSDRNFVLKNTVIIDVGYRSTDITILMQFKPVGASAASRPIGGINLEANIQSRLERDNYFVNTSTIQKSLSTIYAIDSDTMDLIDITDYVQKAKDTNTEDYMTKTIELAAIDGINLSKDDISTAVRSHYIVQGQDTVDITSYVWAAKDMFVDAVHRAALEVVNSKMMNMSEISNVLCIGRPFGGDKDDSHNMMNLLVNKFKEDINMYAVPDAGVANVIEIIQLLGPED